MNTYTKLQSGEWGIRAEGKPNGVVMVSKKDGSTKEEIVGKVLWTGADKRTGKTISLCTIAGKKINRTANRYGEDNRKCQCPHPVDEGDGECMLCGRMMF